MKKQIVIQLHNKTLLSTIEIIQKGTNYMQQRRWIPQMLRREKEGRPKQVQTLRGHLQGEGQEPAKLLCWWNDGVCGPGA